MGEVQARQWTLTDEFAYSVCQLPIRYKRGDEYFQFLEDWGTVSCLQFQNIMAKLIALKFILAKLIAVELHHGKIFSCEIFFT